MLWDYLVIHTPLWVKVAVGVYFSGLLFCSTMALRHYIKYAKTEIKEEV